MSRSIVLIIAGISILCACNNQPEKVADTPKLVIRSTSCYLSVNNRDTVMLSTITEGTDVTGTLSYNYFEKDKNTGTIVGKMKGELLIADYKFQSEGVETTRQVAFRKQEENFVEGYGASEVSAEGAKFRNTDSLDFSHSVPLIPVKCP